MSKSVQTPSADDSHGLIFVTYDHYKTFAEIR